MRTPLIVVIALAGCAGGFSMVSPETAQSFFAHQVEGREFQADRPSLEAVVQAVLHDAGFETFDPWRSETGVSWTARLRDPSAHAPQLGLSYSRSFTPTLDASNLYVWARQEGDRFRISVRRSETREYTAQRRQEISHLPRYDRFTESDPYLALKIIERLDPAAARSLWRAEPTGERSLRCALGSTVTGFDDTGCGADATAPVAVR